MDQTGATKAALEAAADAADAAKLLRLRSMLGAVLDEVRSMPPDPVVAERAADLARAVVVEVGSAVSEAELGELGALVGDVDQRLSLGETRVLDAQLVGWLDGLAMAHQLEGAQAAVALELQRVRELQSAASLEARRQARSML